MPDRKWKDSIGGRRLQPESLMMGYGYRPEWSEGSLKAPIFQTSTFVFETAEEGKAFFELAHGVREPEPGEHLGMIYSRLNNPSLEILEDRLAIWDGGEVAGAFVSGMAAISTTLLTHLRPGDVILHSDPVYGGTDHLVREILPSMGIESLAFTSTTSLHEVEAMVRAHGAEGRLKMILIETPGNPTNCLIDISRCAELARRFSTEERKVYLAVDNTFLGPLFQHPLQHGADYVIYSATKFIGGHSDLIAGACIGSAEDMGPVLAMRTFLGTMMDAWTAWLLTRSLETLELRMTRQAENAKRVAGFLVDHPKVRSINYLGLLEAGDPQYDLFKRQCLSPGAMISFEVEGGEAAAFRFLNALELIHLAVSLGGTESLAEHPASMTHAGVPRDVCNAVGVTDGLARISVGVENAEDIILDIAHALDAV